MVHALQHVARATGHCMHSCEYRQTGRQADRQTGSHASALHHQSQRNACIGTASSHKVRRARRKIRPQERKGGGGEARSARSAIHPSDFDRPQSEAQARERRGGELTCPIARQRTVSAAGHVQMAVRLQACNLSRPFEITGGAAARECYVRHYHASRRGFGTEDGLEYRDGEVK